VRFALSRPCRRAKRLAAQADALFIPGHEGITGIGLGGGEGVTIDPGGHAVQT